MELIGSCAGMRASELKDEVGRMNAAREKPGGLHGASRSVCCLLRGVQKPVFLEQTGFS